VQGLCFLWWSAPEALAAAERALASSLGAIDFRGEDHPFTVSGYYDEEMGPGLRKRLVAFAPLAAAEDLPAAKLAACRIEQETSAGGARRVNLDVGYLDHHKLVLASAKAAGQKIALGRGIYADMLCRCREGKLEWLEWAFPDFRDGRYDRELLELRARYLERLREWRRCR
jgi:hypothetical protein